MGRLLGTTRMQGVRSAQLDRQRRAEAAGAGLHDGHTGPKSAALGGKGEHRLGQAVLRGAGCPAEIEIG